MQVDLKWQKAEGHGMPVEDLSTMTEAIQINGSDVRFMKIEALVRAKFQSFGRGFAGDYTDLLFACRKEEYGDAIKGVASKIPLGKRKQFCAEVLVENPADAERVRTVLCLPPPPAAGGGGAAAGSGSAGGSGTAGGAAGSGTAGAAAGSEGGGGSAASSSNK